MSRTGRRGRRLAALLTAGILVIGAANATNPTGWPLEVLTWNLTKAYPGALYEHRLGVKGGAYPYRFTLLEGPTGMNVDPRTGVLRWNAPASASTGNPVQVRITDQDSAALTHAFTIDVSTAGFYFVSPSGSDSNAGTFAKPWQTVDKARTSAGDGIVYVRAGTYTTSTLTMKAGDAHKWLAWPGEKVVIDRAGGIIGLHCSNTIIQGIEFRNGGAKMFWLGGLVRNVIWRKCVMRGIGSTGWDNPCFIFPEDGDYRPIEGRVQYDRLVVQECTFHDLTNPNAHGGSMVCYNVKNLLFEDNDVYDIDGTAISDKDDGYGNTIRNNRLHDCAKGIGMYSQYTQGNVEVCYNLVYGCATAVTIGAQPGYIRDVYLHHNTLVGGNVTFGVITDGAACTTIRLFNNIFSYDLNLVYSIVPVRNPDGSYRYPTWFSSPGRVTVDNNLLWTTGAYVAGHSWGLANKSLAAWQAAGFDKQSVLADPGLSAEYSLPKTSPYYGVYGRDMPDGGAPEDPPSVPRSFRVGDVGE
ncbi:MAG: right-handed parallel beta-helix repeat-containing protein [Kiritimatiellae bacterium]|nr:right-handed parallel beta-helix repeat-containing protein [Kiritimatiellia bacterium]